MRPRSKNPDEETELLRHGLGGTLLLASHMKQTHPFLTGQQERRGQDASFGFLLTLETVTVPAPPLNYTSSPEAGL